MPGIPVLLPALFAVNGVSPANGAKVYAYIKGTSTPQAMYSDAALTTPTANPYICNSLSRGVFYRDPSLSYDILVKTSDDATTLIPTTSFSADANTIDFGSGVADFLADNITGIIVRTRSGLTGVGGAFDSTGATGNGTDNLAYINTAIALAASSPGNVGVEILLPPGIGRFSGPIVNPYDFVHIRGAGEFATGIFVDHTGDGYQDGSSSSFAYRNTVSDLYFFRAATSTNFAVRAYCSDQLVLRNVRNLANGSVAGNGLGAGIAGVAITGAANNGSGLVRITAASHGLLTGCYVRVGFVAGTTEANGLWTVTKITDNTFDLQGSTFANAYVSGGLVAPYTGNIYPQSCLFQFETVGLGVYSCSGGIVGDGNTSFSGILTSGGSPTSGTYALYAPKGTNPFARFDYITGIKGFGGADKNIYINNTRWVNVELDGVILDNWRTKCVHIVNDSVDSTGGGVEIFNIRGARFGLNGTAAEQMIVIDATGASVAKFSATGAKGICTQTAVQVTAHASSYAFTGDFDRMDIELRPTSGTRNGIDLTGYMDRVSVRGVSGYSTSSTYAIDLVKVNSGVIGDVIVEDVMSYNFSATGKLCNDAAGIVRAPYDHGRNVKLQAFQLVLWNDGGTMKHRIGSSVDETTAVPAPLIDLVNGATTTFTATPTGADASTAMAAGGKISSAATSYFILDTTAQTASQIRVDSAVISYNDSDTAATVQVQTLSTDINGTTRRRAALFFRDAATGAAFSLTSAIGAGEFVYVTLAIWMNE